MEAIISQAHRLLIKLNKTVAVAESSTGGLLSNLLTQLPVSSQYFILGVVVYSNKAKISLLKISPRLLSEKGAVSKETAALMASSVRKMAKADFGIGVTGIAGPAGGTSKKPVGTVFIAINGKNSKICKEFHFKGSRLAVRKAAALKSLELLCELLLLSNCRKKLRII